MNIIPVLKRLFTFQQALTRASASQDCARLTSFPIPMPYRGLCGPSIQHVACGCPNLQADTLLQVWTRGQKTEDEGHWAVSLLLPVPNVSNSLREAVLCRVNDPDVVFLKSYLRTYCYSSKFGEGCILYLPLYDLCAYLCIEDHGSDLDMLASAYPTGSQ